MAGILRPRKIEPGCLRRWARNGRDLWQRRPGLLLLNALVIFGVSALVPRILGVPLLLEIPLSALFFVELRALDQGGRGDWATIWTLFQGNLKDIAYLTRDAFVFLFFIVLLLFLSSDVVHAGANVAHTAAVLSPLQQLTQNLLPWLGNALFSGVGWASLLASPVSGPLLFLTLLLGHALRMHLYTAFQGAFLNRKITIALLCLNILIGPLVGSLSLVLLPLLGHTMTGIFLEILTIGLLQVLITVDYLWSREMFEGTTENAPSTLKSSSAVKEDAPLTVASMAGVLQGVRTLQRAGTLQRVRCYD